MSHGHLARNRTLSLGSGRSSQGRNPSLADFSINSATMGREFEPCDATASMFLYAQGNSVVVAHHDTLKIERRFSRHTEEVQILAVDNVSERGAGRLVITYDAGQTAIVWDLMTGDEIARFASYNNLSVAAWMRNGNVAFGNAQGNVILFEPSTSEHISARTIDQIPITALAPSADCRTYAIGYQNGSLLIATLQPRFTILHNLSTSRSPSPIVTLAWHASSSKQKSDMLASQTGDGDLRVWSIAKSPTSSDTAKVVRVLKRNENFQPGANWLGWSKNGRIIQHSDGETSSWDVRTKHVTYETVPTLEHVRGLALYGPGATLFTLGPNNTAQQFDLNSPPVLVANVQHPANLLPPSPPVSIEEQKTGTVTMRADGLSSMPVNLDVVSESDEEHMSPLARIAREMDKLEESQHIPDRSEALSPVSSQASYTSRSSAASRSVRQHGSVLSNHTLMSIGSSLHSKDQRSVVSSRDSLSMSSIGSSHVSGKSRPGRSSRLRQEILQSPEDKVVVDLFKFTKSRLSDIPYRHPSVPDNAKMTNNELRQQMLSTIFGWNGEAEGLIRDELSRYAAGSPSRILLTKWLGDIETDIMATSSESMTASDWMLLALSGIGGQNSQHKVARAYVQRLLEKGDVHTAATIMIGMGDQNDAIEIYVSHKRYMEALILTCHVYPADWGRQSQLIRKWGEWAVQHSQQQLAIRCFSCVGTEPFEPYDSAPAKTTTVVSRTSNIPEMLSPPLSPPGVVPRGPQRNMAKAAALKLVTSFGDAKEKSKFFGVDGDRTPMGGGPGVTPIAESALSPHAGDTVHTAFLRPSQRSVFNTPASARTATPGGFTRHRLPSIGEMPSDVTPSNLRKAAKLAAEAEPSHARKGSQPETLQLTAATYQPTDRAATASPMMQRNQGLRPIHPLPAPSPDNFTTVKQESRARNGSRDRKPDGLQIQWPPMESIITGDYMTTPELSVTSSRHRTPTAHSVSGSVASYSTISSTGRRSPMTSERSFKSHGTSSPMNTSHTLDQYISSLETAQYAKPKQTRSRQTSRDQGADRSKRGRSSSRRGKYEDASEDRGRSAARYVKPAKRSPTSPVPMSPEEFQGAMGAIGFDDHRSETSSNPVTRRPRNDSQATAKPGSKTTSRIRRHSPEPLRINTGSRPASRTSSRMTSGRKASPDPSLTTREGRGRSQAREGAIVRSPSSPLPMSPEARFYNPDVDDDAEPQTGKTDRSRVKSRQRSGSRARERGTTSRNASPDRKRRDRSISRSTNGRTREDREVERRERRAPSHTRSTSDMKVGDLTQMKTERQRKKDAAAKELEERRRSLARRPSAPLIMHPEQLSPISYRPSSRNESLLRSSTYPSPSQLPPRSQTVSPESMRPSDSLSKDPIPASVAIGLPATPRAMQHPKFDPDNKDIPEVPQIPDSYYPSPEIVMRSKNDVANLAPLPRTTFTLLPKTTYQVAPRQVPPRSMSAPIPEEPISPKALPAALPTHPAFHAALPPSSRRRTQDIQSQSRKINPGEAQPGTLGYETLNNVPQYLNPSMLIGGIDETIEASGQPINPSNNNLTPPPPPPPPAPPILRELQHLAIPPPPPPAPLYRIVSNQSIPSQASQSSAVIEIVMDDDTATSVASGPPPPPAPAARTSPEKDVVGHSRRSSINHNRGRSQNDNSLSGRFGRATERIRSLSRGNSPQLSRTKSPPISPPMGMNDGSFENMPTFKWVVDQAYRGPGGPTPSTASDRRERHPSEVRAEMMEGGMI